MGVLQGGFIDFLVAFGVDNEVVPDELQHVGGARRRSGRPLSDLGGDRQPELLERLLEKGVDVGDCQRLEPDLLGPIEEREHVVIKGRRDGSGQACHDHGDVEPLADELLVGDDQLLELGDSCLRLVNEDQGSMSEFGEPATQAQKLVLVTFGFLHLSTEFQSRGEAEGTDAAADELGSLLVEMAASVILNLLHDTGKHVLTGDGGRCDNPTLVARPIGQLPEKDGLSRPPLPKQ